MFFIVQNIHVLGLQDCVASWDQLSKFLGVMVVRQGRNNSDCIIMMCAIGHVFSFLTFIESLICIMPQARCCRLCKDA